MAPSPTSLGRAALISLLLSSLIPSSSAIPSPDMSYKQAAFGVLDTSPKPDGGHLHSTAAKRVNVTLGVMSRCPDALACEAAFDKVLERVNTKTHLSMTYIGSLPKTKQSPRYGVECMHGDQECLGNIQQLCVQDALNPRRASEDFDLSPSAAQKKWWSFIQCQNYAGIPSIGSEDLAKRCLKLIDGPDWDKDGISDCINGKKGRKLLKDSVANTHSLNITKSCTVLIESGDHCVRDGGVWKECNIGHEVGDFVSAIERAWEKKNNNSTHSSETFSSRAVSPSSHGMPSLVKRQQAPPPTGSDQSNNNGPFGGQSRTPPSVFTLIIAIALFVLVVAFVLLRIVARNRRLRRLGLLPEGPMDRLIGNTRQIEDTLVPPKLWEAKIAHEWAPSKTDSEARKKGWDAVMPVSAALPPNLYSELFPNDVPVKAKSATVATAPNPAPQQSRANVISRHMPSFLKRGEAAAGADEPAQASEEAEGQSETAMAEKARALESVSASVNVTVLIAMPSPRTVFPHSSTAQLRRTASGSKALKNQGSTNFPPLTKVQSSRLDEVDEDTDEDKSRLRRAPSVKSFRTVGSTKSIADARREAFFGAMTDDDAANKAGRASLDRDGTGPADTVVGGVTSYGNDDDEEEELPELVFGTASVPIYCREASRNYSAAASAAPRLPFSGVSGTYHPVRSELLELVASAHRARERKAHDEAALKAAEDKEAANGDDSHTTIDDRPQSDGRSGLMQGGVGRPSASETIDSEAGIQLTALSSTRQDGLGDVVSRMMANRSTDSPVPVTSLDSGRPLYLAGASENEPRPSVGLASVTTNDDSDTRAATPQVARGANGSSLTLDPLLGDAGRASMSNVPDGTSTSTGVSGQSGTRPTTTNANQRTIAEA